MQKQAIILLLVVVILSSFSFGVVVGVFKIPPYYVLNIMFDVLQGDDEEIADITTYVENDAASIIHIQSEQDIQEKRSQLINYVFKDDNTFFNRVPDRVESNIIDDRYFDMENLERIDKFSILMEHGVNSYPYLFLAQENNKKLVVYHQGHDGDFIKGKETIQTLLKNNYSVLAFSMPITGQNTNPVIELEHFGKFKLVYHDDLLFLETDSFSPLKFFIEPISASLNYVEQQYDFDRYYMTGISGGGWTTGVYSAMDARIEKSFPVAGTAPMFLRFNNPKNMGDYEQTAPGFYRIANYLDQYIMASYGAGREQMQIFNKYDPCCFSGDQYKTYEDDIQNVLSDLGKGHFSIFIDENNQHHSISPASLDAIIRKMDTS